MIVQIGNIEMDAAVVGNQVAIRNFKGPFNALYINGIPRRVVKMTSSPYVPGVVLLTFE